MGLDLENFDHEFKQGRAERRWHEIQVEGKVAGSQGEPLEENPYKGKPEEAAWAEGWKIGKAERKTSELDDK